MLIQIVDDECGNRYVSCAPGQTSSVVRPQPGPGTEFQAQLPCFSLPQRRRS